MKKGLMGKLLSITLATMLCSTILLGCSRSTSSENSGDPKDKFISVLVEGGSPAFNVAKKTAEEFKQKTGYEVKIDTVPYSGVFDKLSSEISANASTHDVATIDVLWFPALAKGLKPMNDVLTDDVKSDLLPGLVSGGTYKGVEYGLPTWTNCKVLLYRKDLFENADNKAKFKSQYSYDLQPPKTWEQYRDIAKFFTRDTNNDGKIDMYGTGVYGLNNGDSVCSWLDHATQAGAKPLVIDENKNVVVNQKPYVDALQMLYDIYKVDKSAPPETLSMASSEVTNLFWNGKLSMMLAWGHFYLPSVQKMPGKVGVAPMISGSAGLGAVPGPWYQVILKSSKKQDIAAQYVKFLYEKNSLYMSELGVAARKSVFEEYGKKPGYEHLKAISDTLSGNYTQNRPSVAQWTQIENEALVPAIQSVLSGNKTPKEALDNAKTSIENIINNK